MKYMSFETPPKKVSKNIFSKSSMSTFNLCPLKAKLKEEFKEEDETRQLLEGKVAHELFAEQIAILKGEDYRPKLHPNPSIMRVARSLIDRINFKDLVGKGKIIDFESFAETILPNGQKLLGVFDLVLFEEDEFFGEYIKILDFKTGFNISKEIDNEAMIYAYLASEVYGLPVMFARYTSRSKDGYFEHLFGLEECKSFEQDIVTQINHMKKVLESNEYPIPKAGPHCSTCPFLDACLEKGYAVDDLDGMINQQRLYEAKAKELKAEIKKYSMENGGSVESEVYKTFIKETSTPKLIITNKLTKHKKAFKKKDFVKLLAESDMLNEFVSALDIKYTPEVLNKAMELGLEIGETVRKDIQIEFTTEDIEGIEDED